MHKEGTQSNKAIGGGGGYLCADADEMRCALIESKIECCKKWAR